MVGARANADRRKTGDEARGRRAEVLAAWWLRLTGHRVLARRFRSPVGEIDLIARRGRALAFVEVKLRGGTDAALEAVTPYQRRRIARAADAYLQRHPWLREFDLRFDVLALAPWRRPVHLRAAWRVDEAATR